MSTKGNDFRMPAQNWRRGYITQNIYRMNLKIAPLATEQIVEALSVRVRTTLQVSVILPERASHCLVSLGGEGSGGNVVPVNTSKAQRLPGYNAAALIKKLHGG